MLVSSVFERKDSTGKVLTAPDFLRQAPLDDVPRYEEVIAEPPEYTEASLRQRRRVGLRQIVIRPDLRTRGLAEEGGLLI